MWASWARSSQAGSVSASGWRALVTKPKLLILDEVTSALDPKTERAICENITALRDRYTTVAITHRPIWAEVASQLYKVQHGSIV